MCSNRHKKMCIIRIWQRVYLQLDCCVLMSHVVCRGFKISFLWNLTKYPSFHSSGISSLSQIVSMIPQGILVDLLTSASIASAGTPSVTQCYDGFTDVRYPLLACQCHCSLVINLLLVVCLSCLMEQACSVILQSIRSIFSFAKLSCSECQNFFLTHFIINNRFVWRKQNRNFELTRSHMAADYSSSYMGRKY